MGVELVNISVMSLTKPTAYSFKVKFELRTVFGCLAGRGYPSEATSMNDPMTTDDPMSNVGAKVIYKFSLLTKDQKLSRVEDV